MINKFLHNSLTFILIMILFILSFKLIKNQESFINEKYNCPEVMKLRDKYYETPVDIDMSVCKDKIKVASYDDYSKIDLSKFTNNTENIDDKYFKITNYTSRDQDNKPIKLASIKSYLGLPGYLPANISYETNDLKYFESNYLLLPGYLPTTLTSNNEKSDINKDIDALKKRVVSNAYNSTFKSVVY